MKTRKTLALLLVLVMMMGLLSFSALAAQTTSITNDGLTMQFGDPGATPTAPECDMRFSPNGSNTYDVVYAGNLTNYYPGELALFITTGASTITNISTTGGVSVQPTFTDNNNNILPTSDVKSGFYIITIFADGTATFTTGTGSTTLSFDTIASVGSTGACAYLPAPGQFTNEGITIGGWGDAFTSSGTLKPLVNANSSTGVSLGAFGGYAVFDFGVPAKTNGVVTSGIYNDPTNKYGVDFIVYGNAFNNNAEPGCIQVSVDGNTWYDIAGSLHYNSGTIWDYSATYTNPTPADDALTPAANNLGHLASVPYTFTSSYIGGVSTSTGSGTGTVDKNNFHNHSWFPLQCNYFTNRHSFGTGGLANLALTSEFAGHTLYDAATSTAATVTLSGVKIPFSNGTNDNYLFGYADCHPNGTYSATQVNPYTAGRTSGGDPIDISWAVYPAGSKDSNNNDISGRPVNLTAIRYVRVYTGVQKVDALFGETSTEITGVYRATATGSGTTGAPTTITVNSQTPTTTNGTITDVTYLYSSATVTVTGYGSGSVYINGVATTTANITPTSAGTKVQIIVQEGTAAPYITWLNLKSYS